MLGKELNMSPVIEQELFKMNPTLEKTCTTVEAYISNSWLEIDANGFGVAYLVEIDNKGCLRNKYVISIDSYHPHRHDFPQGLYKLTYCPEDVQFGFPVPITAATYISP